MDLDVVEAEQLADPKAKVQQLKNFFLCFRLSAMTSF